MSKLSWQSGCPDCGGTQYYNGPEGGMCTNICCANPECRSAFNVSPFTCERIGNTTFRSAFPDNPAESEHYKQEERSLPVKEVGRE